MDEKINKAVVLTIIIAVPALIAAIVAASFALPIAGQIADNSITSAMIVARAVTTEKLADGSVDLDKLSGEVVGIIAAAKEAPIESEEIAGGAVTGNKLADNAVTGRKIAGETITNADIAKEAAIEDRKLAGLYLQLGSDLSRGDKAYIGSMDFDGLYSTGGEKVDLSRVFQNIIKIVVVEPSKNGYLFSVDSNGFSNRTFKIKAMYFDPRPTKPGPAAEVLQDTDLSTLTEVKYIAIGN